MTDDELQREIERHEITSEALRESQDTVRALLDATTETALLIDSEGRILALNEVAYERLKRLSPKPVGDRRQELLGQNVFDLFPSGLAEQRKARNEGVIRSGVPSRFEDERIGRWMDNTIYPIFNRDGDVVKLAVFSYDITDRKWAEAALHRALRDEQERARRDPLTGTLNHRAIFEELQKLIERGDGKSTLAVLIVDLDGLKAINDSYGHPMGDAALIAIADALLRDGAIVGRYGGDEFVALLPGADRTRAERFMREIEEKLRGIELIGDSSGDVIPVQASIGIAIYPDEATAASSLVELADSGMYAQKRGSAVTRPGRQAA